MILAASDGVYRFCVPSFENKNDSCGKTKNEYVFLVKIPGLAL